MATQEQVLQTMADAEAMLTAAEIAQKVETGQNDARAQLSKLKNKAYAEREGDGWRITDAGREAIERGEKIPTTSADVAGDARGLLTYMGQLAGVPRNKITAAVDLIVSGEAFDLEWVQSCLGKVGLLWEQRQMFFNLWQNYVIKTAPPEKAEKAAAVKLAAEPDKVSTPAAAAAAAKDSGLDFILVEDDPTFVGKGMGILTREEAVALAMTRAARGTRTSQSGQGNQGLTAADMLSLADKMNQGRQGAAPKAYVAIQTDEGMKVQAMEEGMPIIVSAPTPAAGNNNPPAPPKTFFLNADGNLEEAAPGHPIILRAAPGAQGSTWVVDNEEGTARKLEPGEPLVLKGKREGSTMVPFKDRDGNPVFLDSRTIQPIIEWEGWQNEQRRKEESHQAVVGVLKVLEKHVGTAAAGIDRLMAGKAEEEGDAKAPAAEKPEAKAPAAEKGGGTVMWECPTCHEQTKVKRGTEQILCTKCDTIVKVTG